MTHSITDAIEKLQTDTPTPPRWLKQVLVLWIIGATYFLGMTHGIQIGGHAQASGAMRVVSAQLPAIHTITMPWAIDGSTAFTPTQELVTSASRAERASIGFGAMAIGTVVGWILRHR
jgi:hypothetical protein